MTRSPLGLVAARRAGRRPGQQVVGPRRAPPAGDRPDRAAAGAEPHHGVEPRRHLRPADRLRPVELPAARRRRARGGRRPRRLAAPRRVAAGRRSRSAPSSAARSATSIDRLRFGAVVDFIHAHVGDWSWYVFNLADAAIVCGVAALVLDSLLPRARAGDVPPDDVLATRRGLRLENHAMPLPIGRLPDRPRAGCLRRGACRRAAATSLGRTFGFVRDAPDEFTVTTRAPLAMPPSFTLPPPVPGATRPQEQSERAKAELALVPQIGARRPAEGSGSPGQQALVQAAGPPATPAIRTEVDQEAKLRPALARDRRQDLMFWRKSAAARHRGRSREGGAAPARELCAWPEPGDRRHADRAAQEARLAGRDLLAIASDQTLRITSRSATHRYSAAPAPATCHAAAVRRCWSRAICRATSWRSASAAFAAPRSRARLACPTARSCLARPSPSRRQGRPWSRPPPSAAGTCWSAGRQWRTTC